MEATIKEALTGFRSAIDSKASPEILTKAKRAAHDAILASKAAGNDITLAKAHCQKCEADAMISGYRMGGPPIEDVVTPEYGEDTIKRLGQDPNKVWGEDLVRGSTPPGMGPDRASSAAVRPEDTGLLRDDSVQILTDALLADRADKNAKRSLKAAAKSAVAKLSADGKFKTLSDEEEDEVKRRTKDRIEEGEDPEEAADDEIGRLGRIKARAALDATGGLVAGRIGRTVNSGPINEGRSYSSPTPATIGYEAAPWEPQVQRLLAAADDHCRMVGGGAVPNPDSNAVRSLRAFNKSRVVDRLVEEFKKERMAAKDMNTWMNMGDSLLNPTEESFFKCVGDGFMAFGDDTTTANLFNQPAIMTYLLVQSFYDMQMLPLVHCFGPGINQGSGGFAPSDGSVGSVLKIPVELYTPPANWGYTDLVADLYLEFPEDSGIDEAVVSTNWLTFAPVWKRIAAGMTRDGIRNMGTGPLNYPVVARHLFHMAWDKSRRIDRLLINEMLQTSDEYMPGSATAQTNTTGNNLLPNNSVFPASGAVTINMNPAKTAVSAVAAGDAFRTYGTGDSAGGVAVTGALRLLSGAANADAAPYYGDGVGPVPTLRTRVGQTLNAAGQVSNTYNFQASVTAPGSAVQGFLNQYGDIMSYPGTVATYAIDYEYGVIIFASGVTGSAGVMTTTVTLTYWWSTNYDRFNLGATPPTGVTEQEYYNGLLSQVDFTSSNMADAPRYVKPDVALMSIGTSPYITTASIFYKFNSPDGTALWPAEQFFFERTGVLGCRVNVPWYARNHRILLDRIGTTKYAIQTPFEMRGPYPAYDSSGRIKAKDLYYGEENSVVATPLVTDQSGVVQNPVSKSILLDGIAQPAA